EKFPKNYRLGEGVGVGVGAGEGVGKNSPSSADDDVSADSLLDGETHQPPTQDEQQEAWFEIVWPLYWRRVSKGAALRAFRNKVKGAATFHTVCQAIDEQRAMQMQKEARYRPHFATWLNDQRWLDEKTAVTDHLDAARQKLKD